jgi:hypothetical protein
MQLPSNLNDPHNLRIAIERIVRSIADTTGVVTLRTSQTTTTVVHNKVNSRSVISLTPNSANAASALATTYVVAQSGQFVIYHASATTTDRTFGYSINGV